MGLLKSLCLRLPVWPMPGVQTSPSSLSPAFTNQLLSTAFIPPIYLLRVNELYDSSPSHSSSTTFSIYTILRFRLCQIDHSNKCQVLSKFLSCIAYAIPKSHCLILVFICFFNKKRSPKKNIHNDLVQRLHKPHTRWNKLTCKPFYIVFIR